MKKFLCSLGLAGILLALGCEKSDVPRVQVSAQEGYQNKPGELVFHDTKTNRYYFDENFDGTLDRVLYRKYTYSGKYEVMEITKDSPALKKHIENYLQVRELAKNGN